MAQGPWVSPGIDRRRSDRILYSIPLVIRGVDLLGQQFEERATTTDLNVQGCRYASRHHLPKNAWVTVDVEPTRVEVRARVVWIEHPHTIRDYFQIALELESPLNPWGLDATPDNWTLAQAPAPERFLPMENQLNDVWTPAPATSMEAQPNQGWEPAPQAAPSIEAEPNEGWASAPMDSRYAPPADAMPAPPEPMGEPAPNFSGDASFVPQPESPQPVEYANAGFSSPEQVPAPSQAQEPELVQVVARQFEAARQNAEAGFAEAIGSKAREIQTAWEAGAEQVLDQCRAVLSQLDDRLQALRWESASANDLVNRLAAARLESEAQQTAAQEDPPAESAEELQAAAKWSERIESSTAAAVVQWDELLQSSLDSSIGRVAEKISAHLQQQIQDAEATIAERSVAFRQPLEQMAAEARQTIASVHSSLDQQVLGARASLAEIEQLAARLREHSITLEAVNRDTLDQVGLRLAQLVEAQSGELNRRVESLVAGVPERVGSDLDSMTSLAVERAVRQVESHIRPQLDRMAQLAQEVSGREMQAEESLRLYRERLRQIAQTQQREVDAQLAGTVAALRDDFDAARADALPKWNEELDAAGARASQSTSESLSRASEWFEQETRSRLQVILEQSLSLAMSAFDERMAAAAQNFEVQMHEKLSRQAGDAQQRIEDTAFEATGRVRSQIDQAAEAAAASFGEVVRGVSDRERWNFEEASRASLSQHENRVQELAAQAEQHHRESVAAVDRMRAQLWADIENGLASARNTLASELASVQERQRGQGDEHHREWSENLRRTGEDVAQQHRNRLQGTSDEWVDSAVRRLNDQGQNLVETLMRSADTALRESWSKIFEGLAATLRESGSTPSHTDIMPPGEGASESPQQTQ